LGNGSVFFFANFHRKKSSNAAFPQKEKEFSTKVVFSTKETAFSTN
jgi:hypothetical protein